jgi:hypothetical protein
MDMDTISIETVRRHAARNGSHFFDPDTMRFFRSRVANVAYRTADGTRAYFVTSEQFVPSRGEPAPRRYSVRYADFAEKEYPASCIEEASKFQEYPSRGVADRAARHMAEQYDAEHKPEVA